MINITIGTENLSAFHHRVYVLELTKVMAVLLCMHNRSDYETNNNNAA